MKKYLEQYFQYNRFSIGLAALLLCVLLLGMPACKTAPISTTTEPLMPSRAGSPPTSQSKPTAAADSNTTRELTLMSLQSTKRISLGLLGNLQVWVSLEAIVDPDYLDYIRTETNALVITHFTFPGEDEPELAALGRAVAYKLNNNALQDALHAVKDFKSGDVVHLPLSSQVRSHSVFPVQHLFVILFNTGSHEEEKAQAIEKGLAQIGQISNQMGVQNLIVPPLTIYLCDNHRVSFDTLYKVTISGIKKSPFEKTLFFSLYSGWQDFEGCDPSEALNPLQDAVEALKKSWSSFTSEDSIRN